MPQEVNIFVLLFGGLQAALLSLLFFKKSRSLPGHWFLAAYLFILTLQIALKVMSKVWLMETMRPLYAFSYQLPFLYGPLIYLFIRQTTGRAKPDYRVIIHFLPSLLAIGCLARGTAMNPAPGWLQPLFQARWSVALQLLSLFCYHVAAWQLLRASRREFLRSGAAIAVLRTNWLGQFILLSCFIGFTISIIICLLYYWFPRYQQLRFGFSVLTLFIYWISYKALTLPEVFGVIKGYAGNNQDKPRFPVFNFHTTAKKYANSGLREEDLNTLVCLAEKKMQQEKLYLLPELTIDELAAKINGTRHHLSQALNEKLGKSFYDYTSHYRVEEAKALLTDPTRSGHKIASIAYDAGFNSISTFNEVFKKRTGLTPSQFRKLEEEKCLRKQRV